MFMAKPIKMMYQRIVGLYEGTINRQSVYLKIVIYNRKSGDNCTI